MQKLQANAAFMRFIVIYWKTTVTTGPQEFEMKHLIDRGISRSMHWAKDEL